VSASPSPSSFFRDHLLDWRRPDVRARIAARLQGAGLVTLDGLERREQAFGLAQVLMKVTAHRDSDPDGLTAIRDTGPRATWPGFAGLGSGELLPHTERSSVPSPPRLMMLALIRPADSGGTCVLVDGRAVHQDLLADHPEAATTLAEDRAALFGGGSGAFAPVFENLADNRIRLRLRQDDLVRFHPRVEPHIPALRAAIQRHRSHLQLSAGQGYLIDNHRWLHARTAFQGPRLAYRALGEPQFGLALAPGFRGPEAQRGAPASVVDLPAGGGART
jgi:hypothetical protein